MKVSNLPGASLAIADSLLRCLPEDSTNGFFVACFVRDPNNVDPIEAEETTTTLSHSSRQEAFKAKSKAKGGKGGVRGGGEIHSATQVGKVKAADVRKELASKPVVKEAKAAKVKVAVPGKKAAYRKFNLLQILALSFC